MEISQNVVAFTEYMNYNNDESKWLKLIYSEKATKFCEISTVDFTSKVQRADLTCDVIRKAARFVLSKL